MLAQLSSQAVQNETGIQWVDRAETGLRRLEAHEDLAQVDWIHASNLVWVPAGTTKRSRSQYRLPHLPPHDA